MHTCLSVTNVFMFVMAFKHNKKSLLLKSLIFFYFSELLTEISIRRCLSVTDVFRNQQNKYECGLTNAIALALH